MAFQLFLALFLVLKALQTFDASEVEPDSDADTLWENFKETHQKEYSPEEEEMRRKHFEENWGKISEHNQRYDQGLHSFTLGLNEYSDMPIEEFSSTMNGVKMDETEEESPIPFVLPDCPVPDSLDWRNKSAVTPVENQGKCGSCYAFVATGALEGQQKLKMGKLVSLSKKNIVDCSDSEGNMGCHGGLMNYAFEYVKRNGGIDSEKSYPYKDEVDACSYKSKDSASQCSGYSDLPKGNETALKIACACIGPIAVAVDAYRYSFQLYKGGIYDEELCDDEFVDHALLLVGYGSENGRDYWLLKNSWGTSWGLDGYMKLARNERNKCGIATLASYPVL